MSIISHMSVDYDAPVVEVQSESSATDLTNDRVPTGQTIKSYLNSNLGTIAIRYDATLGYFPVPNNKTPVGGAQLTLIARNVSSGAFYAIWYDHTSQGFRVGAILKGDAPTQGQAICVQFY